ncbi:MAG: alkaline phosphatase family protein [Myxococcota bacterium]|nr:alkaline phosphatase family protein [Myxococcota bacterium]
MVGLCRWVLPVVCLATLGCGDATRPIQSAVELRLSQIYDAGEWLKRVPVELAVSLYARSKLDGFVRELDLPPELEQRVRARLDADDFVDELVPFLLFLRDVYQPPEGPSAETFDDHVRAAFGPGDAIPGMEHALFRWEPGEAGDSGEGMPALEPELVRQLVAFYDVLYLREQAFAEHVEERLACEARTLEGGLRPATRAATPSVRALLELLRERLGTESEIGGALGGLLEDPARLEAATAALIQFIDQTVCRNYRFFAARAFRARQLRGFLLAELERPGGGDLWAWLERAQTRPHGVVVVVDGLQGALLAALSDGSADSVFLSEVRAEHSRAGGEAPAARSLRAAPAQRIDFLRSMAGEGFRHPAYLPFFRGLRRNVHAHWVPVGVATTPTISVRNIPIALTGAPVAGSGGTGLPNFHFVERGFTRQGEQRGRAYYFFGSDAVDLVSLTKQAGMRTLFDRLPQLGSMSCTAQYEEAAHYGIDALFNLGLGEKLRDIGDRLCAAELERRAETELRLRELRERLQEKRRFLGASRPWWRFWQRLADDQDRALARQWIAEIAELEQRTIPELLTYYNPWPDHFAHFEGPFADAILAPTGELNRLDYWLGRVQAAYATAGVMERTVFGMSGDHGLGPVFHLVDPEAEIFDALREEGVDFRVVKISSDEGEGPKLTNPFDPPTMKGIDVVVASTAGGNLMFDLFVDQDEGFTRQPVAHELRAVRPLARPDAPAIDVIEETAARLADSLDYLAVREEACSPEGGSVLVVGTRGGVRGRGHVERRGQRIRYAFEGVDLLDTAVETPYERLGEAERADHARLRARCMDVDPADPASWCNAGEWRRLTSYTPRPDAVVQLAHLYDSDRAGTINLFPRAGVGYNSIVPGRHAGESFHEKNAFVALWGRPLERRDRVAPMRSAVNGSVPMAIFEHLTGERPARGEDGWGQDPLPPGILRP